MTPTEKRNMIAKRKIGSHIFVHHIEMAIAVHSGGSFDMFEIEPIAEEIPDAWIRNLVLQFGRAVCEANPLTYKMKAKG